MSKAQNNVSDEELERYLVLRRKGFGHYKACRQLSLNARDMNKRMDLDAEFAADVEAAEGEWLEGLEEMYIEMAESGDTKALANILEKRYKQYSPKAQKLEIEGKITHELDGAPLMDQIAQLSSVLAQRAALREGGTILELEGTEVEDDEDS